MEKWLKTIFIITGVCANYSLFGQTDKEIQILKQINSIRADSLLSPIKWDTYLAKAAKHHALYMAYTGKLTHEEENVNGFKSLETLRDRFRQYGANGFGENILFCPLSYSAKEIVLAWMNSPPHRALLMIKIEDKEQAEKLAAGISIVQFNEKVAGVFNIGFLQGK